MEVRSALLWHSIHSVICLLFRQDGRKRPCIWVCRGKFAADGIARASEANIKAYSCGVGFRPLGISSVLPCSTGLCGS
jgi:hypothetical protein